MEAITSGTEQIIIIEAPPRHGKSEFISKYFPAWYLNRFPDNNVILTSYEANFARSWGRKSRAVFEQMCPIFGLEVDPERGAANDWGIKGHLGGMITAGVGGAITGRGGNVLIVDDYMKNSEEACSEVIREKHWDWWGSTASTRLEPGGLAIVMATRWHEDDLSGRLIRDAMSGEGPPVVRLHLPALAKEDDILGRDVGDALWPERWPVERLERRKASMDVFWWNALFGQTPGRHTRTEWPDEYFPPSMWSQRWPEKFEQSTMFIDPSKGRKGGDFSAIVFIGLCGGLLYVDCSIKRRPAPMIVSDAIEMYLRYKPEGVGLESNAFQELLAPELDRQCAERNIAPLPIHLVENKVDKEVRINRLGPYLLRHKFRFCGSSPDCSLLVAQLKEFPMGDHDDGPDALEGAIRIMADIQGMPTDSGSTERIVT